MEITKEVRQGLRGLSGVVGYPSGSGSSSGASGSRVVRAVGSHAPLTNSTIGFVHAYDRFLYTRVISNQGANTTTTTTSTTHVRDVHAIPYELWVEIIEMLPAQADLETVRTLFSMRSVIIDVGRGIEGGEFKFNKYIDRGLLSVTVNRWAMSSPEQVKQLFFMLFIGKITMSDGRQLDESSALQFTLSLFEKHVFRRICPIGLIHLLIQTSIGHSVSEKIFCHCLIYDGNDLLKRDIHHDTPLHAAIREGNHGCAQHILKSAWSSGRLRDVLGARNTNGRTPFHAAYLKKDQVVINAIREFERHDPMLKKHLL